MSDNQFGNGDLATYLANQRAQLSQDREALRNQLGELTMRQREIDRELEAIDAYENAKSGIHAPRKIGKTSAAGSTGRSTRAPRNGSVRDRILTSVKSTDEGMTRGELIKAFGYAGNKSGEMSISNALTALVKGEQLVRQNKRYYLPQTVRSATKTGAQPEGQHYEPQGEHPADQGDTHPDQQGLTTGIAAQ